MSTRSLELACFSCGKQDPLYQDLVLAVEAHPHVNQNIMTNS
jgi:hypothetical protein